MLELEIEKVAHGGVFIARPEGKVVLVHGALPGERVQAEVIEESKSYRRALVRQVLEPSPQRQPHFWSVAEHYAGGADFGHIKLNYQRELKGQVLAEALERMAGVELTPEVQAVCETGLHYRTRIQLHANQAGQAGVKKLRSDEVVIPTDLPLATEEISRAQLLQRQFEPGARVEAISDSAGKVVIQTKADKPQPLEFRAMGRLFQIGSDVFWQAHRAAPDVLASEVLRQFEQLAPKGAVLDLYAGAGLFSANIAATYGQRVTAVELSKSAVSAGKQSAADLKNLKFVQADVLGYLRSIQSAPENLILYPPRSGAAGKVTAEILRLRPKNIVYVACDPIALARDLKQLMAAGYQLRDLSAFDIFPQTHHFESVVSLTLGNL